ncbi:MAG: CvpA family protein [Bacilli bacterium]
MNIIDVCIILLLGLGAVIGFKRGLTKSLATSIGFIAVIILAFILKNPLSELMYQNLPFFNFWGILKGVTVFNILLYEIIAFLIVLALLSIILKLVIFATSIFEKILNMTIILGIPSKIAGLIVGLIEYYVIVYVILFVISLPIFNLDFVNESKYRQPILNNTPILTNISKKTTDVFNEFSNLKNKYEESTDAREFNKEALNVFLKYKVITVESVDKLVLKDKLKIENIETILSQYRKE